MKEILQEEEDLSEIVQLVGKVASSTDYTSILFVHVPPQAGCMVCNACYMGNECKSVQHERGAVVLYIP